MDDILELATQVYLKLAASPKAALSMENLGRLAIVLGSKLICNALTVHWRYVWTGHPGVTSMDMSQKHPLDLLSYLCFFSTRIPIHIVMVKY